MNETGKLEDSMRDKAQASDSCEMGFLNLPWELFGKVLNNLSIKEFRRLQATCNPMNSILQSNGVNYLALKQLVCGDNVDFSLVTPSDESTEHVTLQERLAKLRIKMDGDDGSWFNLVNLIKSTNSCWIIPRFRLKADIPSIPRCVNDSFTSDSRRRFWLFLDRDCKAKDIIYFYNKETGKWWARKLPSIHYFSCEGNHIAICYKPENTYFFEIWHINDNALQSRSSLESSKNAHFLLSMSNHDSTHAWYSADHFTGPGLIKQQQACDFLSLRGTIALPSGTHLKHMSLKPPYLLIATWPCIPYYQLSVGKWDITTLQPLQVVNGFWGKISHLHIADKWGVFVLPSKRSDGLRIEFWNRHNNSSFQQHLSRLPREEDRVYFRLETCYHDCVADVLVLSDSRYILVVPGFEEEIATGKQLLDDCVHIVDFQPYASPFNRCTRPSVCISSLCFADGRMVVALKYFYRSASQHSLAVEQLFSLLTIDLRESRDEGVNPHYLKICMLALATAPIFSMQMDWDCLYLRTFPEFYDRENEQMVKLCELCNIENFRNALGGDVFWEKLDGQKYPAYQHPEQHQALTLAQKTKVIDFALKYRENTRQGNGIISLKFAY